MQLPFSFSPLPIHTYTSYNFLITDHLFNNSDDGEMGLHFYPRVACCLLDHPALPFKVVWASWQSSVISEKVKPSFICIIQKRVPQEVKIHILEKTSLNLNFTTIWPINLLLGREGISGNFNENLTNSVLIIENSDRSPSWNRILSWVTNCCYEL